MDFKLTLWYLMPEDLHKEMEELINKTILGESAVNSSLKTNPRMVEAHEEFYELRLPKSRIWGLHNNLPAFMCEYYFNI